MDAHALADELSTLLAHESCSLARHVEEATPYLTPRTFKLWRHVREVLDLDRGHAARLTALLDRLGLPQRTRPFDTDVATFHFARMEYVLEHLLAEKRRQVESYDRAIALAAGDAATRSELEALAADSRRQVEELEQALRQTKAA